MSTKTDEQYQYITWQDVHKYLEEVTRAHGGHVQVRIVNNPKPDGRWKLGVGLVWAGELEKLHAGGTWGEWGVFPHPDFKTMPALLVRLALRLDSKMTEAETMKQAGLPF